jgi:hypothetical protein
MMQITVNGSVITEAEIARETQYHPAGSFREARQSAARALVIRELLLQQAGSLGMAGEGVHGTDESRVSAVIEREINVPQADEATCRRYYETHIRRFRSPDLIEARHILFPAPPEDAAAMANARPKAVNAIEMLRQRPDRFAELAREFSACFQPSKVATVDSSDAEAPAGALNLPLCIRGRSALSGTGSKPLRLYPASEVCSAWGLRLLKTQIPAPDKQRLR